MSDKDRKYPQSDKWDQALAEIGYMRCGRLDMASYDARTGEPEKYVYIDSNHSGDVRLTGQYCDEVAYAANRYQPLVAEVARLTRILIATATVYNDEELLKSLTPKPPTGGTE